MQTDMHDMQTDMHEVDQPELSWVAVGDTGCCAVHKEVTLVSDCTKWTNCLGTGSNLHADYFVACVTGFEVQSKGIMTQLQPLTDAYGKQGCCDVTRVDSSWLERRCRC